MDDELRKLLNAQPQTLREKVDAGFVDVEIKVDKPYTHIQSKFTGHPTNVIIALGCALEKIAEDYNIPMEEILSLIYAIHTCSRNGVILTQEAIPKELKNILEQLDRKAPTKETYN
jgi:hypothetical protein